MPSRLSTIALALVFVAVCLVVASSVFGSPATISGRVVRNALLVAGSWSLGTAFGLSWATGQEGRPVMVVAALLSAVLAFILIVTMIG